MGLVDHAKTELKAAGMFDTDSDYNGGLGKAVMELVKVFADQGHSGMSANICVNLFEKVARYEPLVPLTGAASEWNDVSDMSAEPLWQNNRCSRVFKGEDGKAYDVSGKVFREPSGACYTGSESRVYITFPYTPTTEYVDVDEPEDES